MAAHDDLTHLAAAAPTAPPRPGSSPGTLPILLLTTAVLMLVAGVVSVALLARGEDDRGRNATSADPPPRDGGVTDADRTSAIAFARTATPVVIGYDWRTFDTDVEAAKALMTPGQAGRYDATVSSIRDQVVRDRVSSVARSREAGLVGITSERARVLVFVDQDTTRRTGEPSVIAQSVILELAHSHGEWLVDDLVLEDAPDEEPGEPAAERREVLAAATAFGTAFLNVDHRTIDADTTVILDRSTGSFHDLYAAGLDGLRTLARDHETTLTGDVWAAGLVELDGDRAVVLAATEGTATSTTTGGETEQRSYRMRLVLDRVGEEWLTSDLQYVNTGP